MRVIVVLVAALVALAQPLTFPADGGPTGLDGWAARMVASITDDRPATLHLLAGPSRPVVLVPLVLIGIGWCARHRNPRGVLLLAAGPLMAIAINTWLLKPLYGRRIAGSLCYPSGHTAGLVAVAAAFTLLAATTWLRVAVVAATVVAMLAAAAGMIGLDYHHFTDIIGGIGAAIAIVVAVAWILGIGRRGWRTPDSPPPMRATTSPDNGDGPKSPA